MRSGAAVAVGIGVLVASLFAAPHARAADPVRPLPVSPAEAAEAVLHSTPRHLPHARVPLAPRTRALSHIVFGYYPDYVGDDFSTFRFDLLSHVGYFTGGCTASGNYSSGAWPFDGLVAAAHAQGTKVVLVVPCFGDAKISAVIANQSAFVEQLTAAFGAGEMPDGVDLDFESMGAEHLGDFPDFAAAVGQAIRTLNPDAEISAALPAVDWNQAYDYPALAVVLDHLTIMGYGYHYSGGDPGPVSPLDYADEWSGYHYDLAWSVNDYRTAIDDPMMDSEIVLGLPYYGYDWPSSSFAIPGTKTANGSSLRYDGAVAKANGAATYDAGSQSMYYFYDDGATHHQLWYDDATTLTTKYDAAKSDGLGGVAIWALGYDGARPELWDALAASFAVATPAPTPTGTATPATTPGVGDAPGPVGFPAGGGSGARGGCDAGGTGAGGGRGPLGSAVTLAMLCALAVRRGARGRAALTVASNL